MMEWALIDTLLRREPCACRTRIELLEQQVNALANALRIVKEEHSQQRIVTNLLMDRLRVRLQHVHERERWELVSVDPPKQSGE
jgi:hypothetical protein